jgi:tripartite-type tricarboxylate transporter receptor subunit TctC
VVRTNAELNKLLRIPEVRERFGAQGTEVLGGTPEELAAMIRNDIPRYGKLAREYNIRPD